MKVNYFLYKNKRMTKNKVSDPITTIFPTPCLGNTLCEIRHL
jgi:hypothetical protein